MPPAPTGVGSMVAASDPGGSVRSGGLGFVPGGSDAGESQSRTEEEDSRAVGSGAHVLQRRKYQ